MVDPLVLETSAEISVRVRVSLSVQKWVCNSVGSECFPYNEKVGGSNPSRPTKDSFSKLNG